MGPYRKVRPGKVIRNDRIIVESLRHHLYAHILLAFPNYFLKYEEYCIQMKWKDVENIIKEYLLSNK